MEQVWDELLTSGKRIYGIAVDDAHHFKGEFAANRANPGRGWVAVKATGLTAPAVMTALEAGNFYASTGVELEDVVTTPTTLEVRIRPRGNFRYTTTFIGDRGEELAQAYGPTASFDIARYGKKLTYVRARVDDSGGFHAWVQPLFVAR
jgi:hypothetical protein